MKNKKTIPQRKLESEFPIIPMDFIDRMRKKAEKSFREFKIPFPSQTILDSSYDFLLQEAQNASYYEYSIEKLSPGKYGIVEYGERKEMMYVMLSDKLYTQAPNSTGWVYGLEKIGTFSFDLPSGIRHDTCRIVSIENTSTEKALLRYNYFIEATSINFPKPTKGDQEFIDGIWFAVQHMVIVRDMPTIAAGIIKEADFTLSECEGAQKRSGSFNTQMRKFIKEELAQTTNLNNKAYVENTSVGNMVDDSQNVEREISPSLRSYIEVSIKGDDIDTWNLAPGICDKLQSGDKIAINRGSIKKPDFMLGTFSDDTRNIFSQNENRYFGFSNILFIQITEKIYHESHVEFHGKVVPEDGLFYSNK